MKKLLILAMLAAASSGITTAHAAFECTRPYQNSGTIALPVNYSGSTASVYVPTGYTLKLGYVSVNVTVASGARASFEIGTYSGGQYGAHSLPVLTGYNTQDRQASQQVDLYADGGSPVLVRAYRGTGTTTATTARYTISGCLIPAG